MFRNGSLWEEIKMERFEVKNIHISDCLLDVNDHNVYRILNLQVRINSEEVQDLRSRVSNADVHNELAKLFGKTLEAAFLNYCVKSPPEIMKNKKLKFSSYNIYPTIEEADEGRAGWYDLKESENENKETSDR